MPLVSAVTMNHASTLSMISGPCGRS
jgi:hypothetical protein